MKIAKTKQEFMSELQNELSKFGVPDSKEILNDFEEHFEVGRIGGQSEEQICEKIGDITEIAKQYYVTANNGEEEFTPKAENVNFENNYAGQEKQKLNVKPIDYTPNINVGGLIGALCVDIFVLSWALPGLASVVIGYLAIPLSLVVSGFSSFIFGIISIFADVPFFYSSFSPISTMLLGLLLVACAGLLVMLGIVIVKGFINVCKGVINWNSRMIANKDIFQKKGKV